VSTYTLAKGAWAITMVPGAELVRDGAVVIAPHGSIAAVGPAAELVTSYPDAETVGDGNGIVMPGMVNAHTHLTESLIAGMAEDATLWEWGDRLINLSARVITREEVALGTRLKAIEMMTSGVTTVSDMSCHRNVGSLASLGAADGLAAMGLRGVCSFGAEDVYDGASAPASYLDEHYALADRVASEPLLTFRCGFGTILGLSDQLFELSIAACAEHGWAVHTHLAEVREEVTQGRLRFGATTIEHADRKGLLDHQVVAAHCIWCSDHDVGLLASSETAVAHNPVANMILASGVCPVPRFRREGITIALGTDGAASNDSQDMFGTLKTAALLQKVVHLDATALRARDVVEMATIGGARALGLDHLVGSLEPGKRADIVLLDGNTPELATIHDPWQQLVYCTTARSVSDVWVDGVRRVQRGEVLGVDLPALAGEARAAAAEHARRAGLGAESVYTEAGDAAGAAPATPSAASLASESPSFKRAATTAPAPASKNRGSR
jgi:cytosine/adenosine deaminase-related metal-dependent hydrolase